MTIDNTKFRGLYHFNSGGVGTDSSGNGNDLSISGTTNPAGKLNEALFTDVVDDTVYNDSIISDLSSDTVGSISFILNIDDLAVNQQQTVLSISNNASAPITEITVFADTRGAVNKFLIIAQVGGVQKYFFRSASLLSNLSGWAFINVTHNGTEPFLYINNSLENITYDSQTDKTVWMQNLVSATDPVIRLGIGNLWRNGVVAQRGQVKIDELIISGQHFTSTEVSEYWNSGAGQEFSGVSGNSRRKIIQQRMLNV